MGKSACNTEQCQEKTSVSDTNPANCADPPACKSNEQEEYLFRVPSKVEGLSGNWRLACFLAAAGLIMNIVGSDYTSAWRSWGDEGWFTLCVLVLISVATGLSPGIPATVAAWENKDRERSRIEVRRMVSGLGFLAVALSVAPSGLCGVITAAAWSTAVFALKPLAFSGERATQETKPHPNVEASSEMKKKKS
ncbi:hypothetical protein CEUSTIGMA_g8369.t1 [Chlamydomonas eustigma]|uniref:Uncharacterized protein n=1 Tax=Chlamydomonas eustigma TaxID=1157962 RepID=A0A250XCX6_9CHLO|nr:hypothetical protein CEUSTIGMA_g8369.t1 [Chlamydomonas eustigma]|eukprot:GAX80934.1 hypothetical protein CEUSTIGMA_g8369.t1 [Chlamydomonas eustigma]